MQNLSPSQTTQKTSRTVLYVTLLLIIIGVAGFFILKKDFFKRQKPLTQEEKAEIFKETKKTVPQSTLTQEEKAEIFQETKKTVPQSTLTQEEKAEIFKETKKTQ